MWRSGWLGVGAVVGLGLLVLGNVIVRGQPGVYREIQPRPELHRRSPFEAALGEAGVWRVRAQQAVNWERAALEAWDPDALPFSECDRWRLQALARDRQGHLRRARAEADRAAALARAPEEVARVALRRALIEHDLGEHAAELWQSQRAAAQAPHRDDAWKTLRRAARCNHLPGEIRRAEAALRSSSGVDLDE